MMTTLGNVVDAMLDCVFPQRCGACDALGQAPLCRLCEEASLPSPPLHLPGFEHVVAVYEYGGPVALAVKALKFDNRPELGRAFGLKMDAALRALCGVDALVVPVPLASSRLANRGYNQSRELIRGLSLPARTRALHRVGDPPPQVGLPRPERILNQDGRFVADPRWVRNREVWLVDDVVTTGATAMAAQDALRSAGARNVSLLALCAASHPESRGPWDHRRISNPQTPGLDTGSLGRHGPVL